MKITIEFKLGKKEIDNRVRWMSDTLASILAAKYGPQFTEEPEEAGEEAQEEEEEEEKEREEEIRPTKRRSRPARKGASGDAKLDPEVENAWKSFLFSWLKGLDADTLTPINPDEQPDRVQILRDLHNAPEALHILQLISHFGSIQRAVKHTLRCSDDFAKKVADSIVSPASILFPDLSDLYDFRKNPLK